MKQTRLNTVLSCVLCTVLIAAMALTATGCSGSKSQSPSEVLTEAYSPADTPHALGEGEVTFPLCVTHLDGTQVNFDISTDQSTVGAALVEIGLIAGEDGPYGLMVTEVNGERRVYDEDKTYWGFYIDGQYATSGVDTTEITPDQTYELRAEGT